jgi:hypothetical protein
MGHHDFVSRRQPFQFGVTWNSSANSANWRRERSGLSGLNATGSEHLTHDNWQRVGIFLGISPEKCDSPDFGPGRGLGW